MKIAIVGAGFSGLSAGYFLAKKGYPATLFEKDPAPGGLAVGYSKKNWLWPLEKHYHHLFASDSEIIKLAKELNVKINFYHSLSSILTPKGIFPLDSPMSLLKFPLLNPSSKLKTGLTLSFLKLLPFWQVIEGTAAKSLILKSMGESSWKSIWEPLLIGKFGQYADSVSASWFWARIKKRTPLLGYPEGGFTTLARKIASAIEKMGGKIYYRQQISSFQKELAGFDQVISTVPRRNVPFLGTINLVLRFKKPFLPNNIYWLNIATPKFPFLSVIEHTNLISSKNYGGEHLVYVGQYLSPNQTEFSLTDKELLQKYHGDLKKINPGYQSLLSGFDVFKDPYTQPVFPLNYSRTASFLNKTVGGIFQASIEQVYPWDRGTNYAVALGRGVAETIIKKNEK